jgi:serine/threonine protein kinase
MNKFIGDGSYGCVFKPAFECKDKKRKSKNIEMISKIFHRDSSARNELFEYTNVVKKIDPRGKFTVKLYDSCKVSKSDISPSEFRKCNTNSKYNANEFEQIVYENGGVDLYRAVNHVYFENIVLAALPFFKGLIKLANKGYVHNDIKTLNVVYNVNTDKLSMIDFGIVEPNDRIFNINRPYSHYLYYPPEYEMFNVFMTMPVLYIQDLYKKLSVDLSSCSKQEVLEVQKIVMDNFLYGYSRFNKDCVFKVRNQYKINIKPLLWNNIILINTIKAFRNAYNACEIDKESFINYELSLNTKLKIKAHFDQYVNRVDVYMTGLMMIELLMGMLNKHKVHIDTLEDPMVITEIIIMCSRMINVDSSQRYTSRQALVHFKNIHNRLYTLKQLKNETV